VAADTDEVVGKDEDVRKEEDESKTKGRELEIPVQQGVTAEREDKAGNFK